MSEDKDDSTLLLTFEFLHSLVRESQALEKAIERLLVLDNGNSSNINSPHGDDYHKRRSFYRDLEWRISKNQISLSKANHALGLIIREVDFFRITIQNFYGSVTKNQPLTPNKRPVKLEPLIEEVVDLFDFSAANKGVEIRTHITGDPILRIDRELIHRMLVNLVDNAIKYSYSSADTTHQRFISIECRRHSAHGDWMISVASYGVGIDEDEITSGYIFEYGTRGKFSDDRGRSGTGIGLAESKRIIEAHNGKIQIDSNRLAGDTFLTTVKVIIPST